MTHSIAEEVPAEEGALKETIEACDYLIEAGFEAPSHVELRALCVVALEKLSPACEKPKRPYRKGVKLKRSRRPLKPWELRLGLNKPYVGEGDEYYHMALHERPRTRGDCKNLPRPCPFIGCRHNLWMDILPTSCDIKPPQ